MWDDNISSLRCFAEYQLSISTGVPTLLFTLQVDNHAVVWATYVYVAAVVATVELGRSTDWGGSCGALRRAQHAVYESAV